MSIASPASESARAAVSDELVAEQDRARQTAAARRGRRRLYVLGIRVFSLAVVLSVWQLVGQRIDPILFTTPTAVSLAALQMVASGELWTHIVLPAALPFIVTGLRLAVGRGLIGMVLADLYTAISGIGYLIVRSASTYRVDKMFVPIVVLGLLGITLTALLRAAERWVAPWTAADAE